MFFQACVKRPVALCSSTGEDGKMEEKGAEEEIRRRKDVIYSPELVHTC